MVGFQIIFIIDRSKRHEFFQTFESLSRPEDRDDGCLDQGLFDQIGWNDRLLWGEHWKSMSLLEAHMGSSRFQTLIGAIEVLGQVENMKFMEFQAPVTVS